MSEFKLNFIFAENGDSFEELFYEGLQEFIAEKINLKFCD